MKKILLVDVGNTRIKWALCIKNMAQKDRIGEQIVFPWDKKNLATDLTSHWNHLKQPDAIYISNVAGIAIGRSLSDWCQEHWNIHPDFAEVTDVCGGVINSYPEPDKLGVDRWLAMIAGRALTKGNVCVIDCGSAVTIDVINSKGVHQGGMIAPGLALSGRALTDHTHALTAKNSRDFPMLSNNTEDAISSGCYHQFIGGIQHVIEKIQQQLSSDMEYIITGGDAELVLAALEFEKMRHEPNLILQGLILSSK